MNLGVRLFGARTRGLDVVLELYPLTSAPTPGVLYVSVVLYLFVYVFTWAWELPCICVYAHTEARG